MSYKITDTVIVDQNRNIGSIGIASFAGPVIIGGGNSTGTVSQPLQVTGSNGAYIGGNLGIGSTNPSSKLWVSGDIYNTGIHTAQILSASKDPGTGITTDFTNSLFGNGWRLSAPASTTYYKLASLPPGSSGSTFDHLKIDGILGAWTNGNQTPFEIIFSNRGTFNYKYTSYGSVRTDVRILGISTNSSVEIWAQHQASQFTKLVYNIPNSIESIVVSNPTSTTTAPTGTTVFDSSTATPRFIINESDNLGIGTISPTSKLQVVGDVLVSGVITATSFSGNVSSATTSGIATSVIGGIGSITQLQVTGISTFTNGPVLIGSGTSTGTASQTLQVTGGAFFNGLVGLGTTNPTVGLQLSPNASISNVGTGITLAGTVGSTLTVAQFVYANTNTSYLRIKATRNTDGSSWFSASTKLLQVTDATEQGYIEYNPNGSLFGMAFGQGSTEWARFTSTGNFGIGRTNPSNKLEVLGTIAAYSADTTSVGSFAISNAGLCDITAYKSTGTNLRFIVADTSGVNQERVRIDTFGNILVGTSSSTGTALQRLQVTGGAYVSSNVGVAVTSPSFAVDIAGDARVTSTNKMRFGGTAGTTNFYIQYNSTANSLDFVAG